MYKGKFGYWASIIATVLIIQFIISVIFPWVGSWFYEENVTMYADCMVDPGFFEVLGDSHVDDFHFSVDSESPDFYFCDSSDDAAKPGYTKHSDFLYSPLVLYVRYAVYANSEGFSRISPKSGDSSPLQIDLYDILVGMEEGKEWKDIGVSTKVVKGPITLVIPNERSPYYNDVVELFYMTLNGLTPPTEEDYETLAPRVEALLEKCEKTSDISQGLISEYKKHSVNYKVFIGPEYLFVRGGDETGRNNNNNQFNPVYFMNTVFVTMDVYTKDNANGDTSETIVDRVMDNLITEKYFYDRTGWRVEGSYLDMSYVSYSLPNTVTGY